MERNRLQMLVPVGRDPREAGAEAEVAAQIMIGW